MATSHTAQVRNRWIAAGIVLLILLAAIPIVVAPLLADRVIANIDGADDLDAAARVAAELNARRLMLDWSFRVGVGIAAVAGFMIFRRRSSAVDDQIAAANDQVEASRYQVQAIYAQIEAQQKTTDEQIRLTRSQLQINLAEVKRLSEQSQQDGWSEQYTQAIAQSGHPSVDVRVGGIFLLERIAKEDPANFAETIYEVLVASFREHTRADPATESLISDLTEAQANNERNNETLPQIPAIGSDAEAVLQVLARNRELFDTHVERLREDLANVKSATGPHFVGVNLSGAWLRNADLRGATLTDVDFSKARLDSTNLSEATLTDTFFSNGTITDCAFDKAKIDGGGFGWTNIVGTSFDGADIEETYFGDANIVASHFNDTHMTKVRFVFAKLADSTFEGTRISGADFEKSTVANSRFGNITMADADFHAASMTSTLFDKVIIADSDFSETGFTDTRFEEATLTGVNFPEGFV